MDNSASEAARQVKTKPFLIDKELKTNDLRQTAANRASGPGRTQPKTRIKPPDSLRRGASQAAGAAPTLRYGPAGDSAPRLRLGVLVCPKGSLSAHPHGPPPLLPLNFSYDAMFKDLRMPALLTARSPGSPRPCTCAHVWLRGGSRRGSCHVQACPATPWRLRSRLRQRC